MDWLYQGLVTNWLSSLLTFLFLAVGGAVLTYLKNKRPKWFQFLLWTLIGMGLLAIISLPFLFITLAPKRPRQISVDNIQSNIRIWLDNFRFSVKKGDDPKTFFLLEVTLSNGTPIQIYRPTALDRYIIIRSAVELSLQHKAIFEKMSKDEATSLLVELLLEMSRTKVGYVLDPASQKITLTRRIPITADLTEAYFMSNIDEIDSAAILASYVLALKLDQIEKKQKDSKH